MPLLRRLALFFAIALSAVSTLATFASAASAASGKESAIKADPPPAVSVKELPQGAVRPVAWRTALPGTKAVTDGTGSFLYVRLGEDGSPAEVLLSTHQPDNLADLAKPGQARLFAFGGSRISFGGNGMKVVQLLPTGGIRMSGKAMPANATDPAAAYLKAAVGPGAKPLAQWMRDEGWPTWLDNGAPLPTVKANPHAQVPANAADDARAKARARAMAEAAGRPAPDAPPRTTTQDSRLHLYVLMRDQNRIKELLAQGADINARGRRGDTPLHRAAFFDRVEMARLLIEAGAALDMANDEGRTPLHHSVFYDRSAMVTVLLESKADVNARDARGRTPLHMVIETRRLKYIAPLLEAGARLDILNTSDQTPLDLARANHFDEAVVLLEAEAARRAKPAGAE